MYGPPQVCKQKLLMAVWSAQMHSAFVGICDPGHDGFRPLSSSLAFWPRWAATDIRFRKRLFDRCAIFVIRQQTWQETDPVRRHAGVLKPNLAMLAAICATCASKCVRGFLA
jgi:hypothetical protein